MNTFIVFPMHDCFLIIFFQPEEMGAPEFMPTIAATLARFHAIPFPVRARFEGIHVQCMQQLWDWLWVQHHWCCCALHGYNIVGESEVGECVKE